MIRLRGVTKAFGGKALFSELDFQVGPGSRVGLVGPNGAGKSTLMRIIVGEQEADDGEVELPRGYDLGYLPQELTVQTEEPVLEFVLRGATRLNAMEAKLKELQHRLDGWDRGDAVGLERLTLEYAQLEERFGRAGGWAKEGRAREIAGGMGFARAEFGKPLSSFSGGWRMRALLCQLLFRAPDALLLDEPTNHLDVESIEWLEGFLKGQDASVVTISHDRAFMNRVCQQIAELSRAGVAVYKGDYDHYLKAREERRQARLKAAGQQRKEIERIESFVERFRYKATKAKQVQSRVKQLNRLEAVDVRELVTPTLRFRLPEPERLPQVVVEVEGVSKAYGEHVVYQGLDFRLCRGECVALVGPNGAGKSTLLKMMAGEVEPDAGSVRVGRGVKVSYFAQHSVDQLHMSRTVLEELRESATPETAGRVRDILGAFGFSSGAVDKRIRVLSGGEKTRLALAKLLLDPAGCLLLDEPTNHLDITSRELLEQALGAFGGALCIVSHDRAFLEAVVRKVVHVEDSGVEEYLGDYSYYRWHRERDGSENFIQHNTSVERSSSRKDVRRQLAQLRREKAAEVGERAKRSEALEGEIAALEERHGELEAKLASPTTYDDPEAAAELNREYAGVSERIDELMDDWGELLEEIEEIEARYSAREHTIRRE
ncbi:MAG: ABC-F family ATP-binding cassette domain-containing protein [Myxococcota bacterium]